jgi:sugar lactone lactonase YvrE
MKVDTEGNVYCGGAGGLWVLDAKGKKLGRIAHGQPATTNMGFGGTTGKPSTSPAVRNSARST